MINEELQDIMQKADRFHLYQNLLDAVKGALNRAVLVTITIPQDLTETESAKEIDVGKKSYSMWIICLCGKRNVINLFFRYVLSLKKVVAIVKSQEGWVSGQRLFKKIRK